MKDVYAYRRGCVDRCHVQGHHSLDNLRHRPLDIWRRVYQELDHVIRLLSILPGGIETFQNSRSHQFSRLLSYLLKRHKSNDETGFGVSIDPSRSLHSQIISRFQPLWEESDHISCYDHCLGICNCVIKICFISALKYQYTMRAHWGR